MLESKDLQDIIESEGREVSVLGARVHNLTNIDVAIPRNTLTVITGLSGSGKSSLAFDTIYAEGQRRYIETMSAYARKFIGEMERPDVDKITGLSPVISIEQKTTIRNPRSTVGTITEIYDFMRLLFARAGEAYSYLTGEKMVKYTDDQIVDLIGKEYSGKKVIILAPLIQGRKGHYKELFEKYRKKGYLNIRIDGNLQEIQPGMKVERYKNHHIELVIDKLRIDENEGKRLKQSVKTAMDEGKGILMLMEYDSEKTRYFSRKLMCPTTGLSYNEPAPHTFSFNSPQGACPKCNGLGVVDDINLERAIPSQKLSIREGGIEPFGKYKDILIFWQLEAIAKKYGFTLDTPIEKIPREAMDIILYGSEEPFRLHSSPLGRSSKYSLKFDGLVNYLLHSHRAAKSKGSKWTERYIRKVTCSMCEGTRLKNEALYFKIDGKHIAELSRMDINELSQWFSDLESRMTRKQTLIARDVLKEIRNRLNFLLEVGLEYLTPDRPARSLSGGESQRIRLATQIGSQLVNVLYILDEPSIGLHQRDNRRLIHSLKQLRDNGNSIMVVEHDKGMILSADHVVDMGPYAGEHGGEVVAQGKPVEIMKQNSLTADYLNLKKKIEVPQKRRAFNNGELILKGARGHNLKNINVKFPLGRFICITGVSGSGKSTLINETLQPILSKSFYRSYKDPLPYEEIEGMEHLNKVIEVDQAPLGRTPRSNPATYTGVFSDIRSLFAQTPEARIRGYKQGRFSFNVKGGRCETCKGAGLQVIEMNFLPDVYVHCKDCNGKRYNRETLEIKYKGKTISDVLDMTIDRASEFFESIPSIYTKLQVMKDVGLGYVTLGQPSTTLSGGESQRVKLAAELARKNTGNTLFILDEPTTGLHFEDVRVLLNVLNSLVDKNNTVIVIEHNMEVIKVADYIIDMGKEGGNRGGEVLVTGTPEEVAESNESYTARFLKDEL
ncbi:MAG: excinuclease ABC subunit UvrA [Bacteroidales bacterium]|nr:excinuclease ABC subunit UvrA [Bacteroidales bacterium]MBS3773935.1 excinuclease ABC subunit UvrA [Bacteroidales bacterium]